MLKHLTWVLLIFVILSIFLQGCSDDSSSTAPAVTGGGTNTGSDWSVQLVKSGNFANGEINVSADADCELYISAYDFNVGLQYITNKSGAWVSTLVAADNGNSEGAQNDIAVDNNGKIHIIYSHYGGIVYATDESGTWSYEDMWLGSGGSCCIVSDSEGNLHSAFDDNNDSDLRYTYKPSGGIWGAKVKIAEEWINSYCDIDVDGSNNPHVIFNFSGHSNLRYALFNGSWSISTIEGSDSYPYIPDTGWTPAIAVNKTTNAANIAFWNKTDSLVQFSNCVPHSAYTLGTSAKWARPCITLDTDGYVHIFYSESGTSALHYATNRSGSWNFTTVPAISAAIGANGLAVAIDKGNKIHVIYSNSSNLYLYHASFQL